MCKPPLIEKLGFTLPTHGASRADLLQEMLDGGDIYVEDDPKQMKGKYKDGGEFVIGAKVQPLQKFNKSTGKVEDKPVIIINADYLKRVHGKRKEPDLAIFTVLLVHESQHVQDRRKGLQYTGAQAEGSATRTAKEYCTNRI